MGKRRISVVQLVVLGCLVVVVVFAVTYFKIFLGGTAPKADTPGGPVPQPLLTFDSTQWPRNGPHETEQNVAGHHVFWFDGPGDSSVRVWLANKNCKCTSVEVALLPDELKSLPGAERDRHSDDQKLVWKELSKEDTTGITLPAHARGGVRLTWKREELGTEKLQADLGTESGQGLGPPITLNVDVDLVTPVMVNPEDNLKEPPPNGEVLIGDLRAGDVRTVNLICWSTTRSDFSLKVQPPEDPCVQCGTPQRLNKEECGRLAQDAGRNLLAAYRVPVTVSERTENGKAQLDLGRMRRTITFTSDGGIDPFHVVLRATVRGIVTVGTPDDRDMVYLGSFEKQEGKTKSIPLSTPDTKLDLAVEGVAIGEGGEVQKTCDFLTWNLALEDQDVGRTWSLTVTVPKNSQTGPLPPHTVLVLKTGGSRPRRIRIPIVGNAYVK